MASHELNIEFFPSRNSRDSDDRKDVLARIREAASKFGARLESVIAQSGNLQRFNVDLPHANEQRFKAAIEQRVGGVFEVGFDAYSGAFSVRQDRSVRNFKNTFGIRA